METIDLTPTPEAYRKMLLVIVMHSTSKSHREWAALELKRVENVKEWSK